MNECLIDSEQQQKNSTSECTKTLVHLKCVFKRSNTWAEIDIKSVVGAAIFQHSLALQFFPR